MNTKENFETINLDKDFVTNKNIFINIDKSQLESYNKIPKLDLSKNNLIIDNSDNNNNKFKINEKLCLGNYCVTPDKLRVLIGNTDGPQFYRNNGNSAAATAATTAATASNTANTAATSTNNNLEKLYYNHDCDIGIDNSTSFKCDINKDKDYPDKLCFNSNDGNNNTTCIESTHFDILKGIKGIKIKNGANNNNISPYYIDFKQDGPGIDGTKDQLFFKNNKECLNDKLLNKPSELKEDLDDKNVKQLLEFTQSDEGNAYFNQNRTWSVKQMWSVKDDLNLKEIKIQINNRWAAYTAAIAAASAAAAFSGGILVAVAAGIGGSFIPSYLDLIRKDIDNIDTIISNIKEEYENNWWTGLPKFGKEDDNIGKTGDYTWNPDENTSKLNTHGKKYPYFNSLDKEVNCDESMCSDKRRFMCPQLCNDKITDTYVDQDGNIVDDATDTEKNDGTQGTKTIKNICPGGACLNLLSDNEFYYLDYMADPQYNGYYLSKDNKNIKYKLKENAIARVSKKYNKNYLNSHRVSGDNSDCSSNNQIANISYYCDGKNNYLEENDRICNPIKYKETELLRCLNNKINEATEEAWTDPDTDFTPTQYTLPEAKTEATNIQGERNLIGECNEEYTGLPYEKSSVNPESGNIPELNFVLEPAKNENGENIVPGTYFHGHSHIH